MIYLFDKDEKLFKIINKPALKTVLQKYALTTEQYVSDRLTVEMKSLDADELEKVEYMAIQTIEDAHTFHYFYVAQKYTEQLTTLIGVQSGIEELRKTPVWDKRPKNAFAKNVINDLLKGTNWQARFVGETTQRSTSFYYISVFEALKKVCKVWDLEMQFFVEMNGNKIGARYIDFKRKIGSAVGKRVVYGHNALQILQEVERTNLFTALIGRGKGEQVSSAEESDKKTDGYGRKITFENVVWDVAKGNPVNKPKGQRFVELPEMTKIYGIKNTDGSIRPKIGFVDFQEEEDPGFLLERTYKALVDAARPQLTLKTTSAYLRGVKVGDTIRVVRHDKKLDYDTRIFEITFNRLNNESSDIKLGDRIGESNEAKAQTIAEKVVDDFVSNEFSDFVQKLPDFLPSPDGFNNNWYGAEDPTVKYPGKVLINDIWFKPDPEHEGHKIMLRWTGEVWDEIVRSYDKELLTKRISEEIANFDKTFQSENEQNKKKIDEILQSSGASSSLAQEAKRIGLDSIAKLEEFKTQATSAQMTLSSDLDALANEVLSKQEQIKDEVNEQVEALVQTKKELAGIKSAQSTFEQSTTRRLAELTNLANGKASKSELVQTAEELTSKIASVQAGSSRNYFKNSRSRTFTTGDQATYDYRTFIVPDFWKNNDRFKRDYVRISFDVTFPVALASDTQANVHFSAHPWYSYKLTFKGGTTKRQHFEFTIDLSSSSETYQTNNVFIRFGTNFGFPAGLQVVIKNAMLSVGNYFPAYQPAYEDQEDRVSTVESNFRQRADSLDAGVSRLTEGLRTKADISSLNVTAENIRQSVKSLETNTQNKLNQMLSLAEFEVRAGSIRQEILNATKDKADKTLVVAEAGKLREEFSNLRVGGTNLLKGSKGPFLPDRKPANFDNAILYAGNTSIYMEQGQEYIVSAKTDGTFTAHHDGNKESDNVVLWIMDKDIRNYQIVSDLKTGTTGTKIIWNKPTGIYHLRVNTYHREATKSVWDVKIEKGTLATDWSPAIEDTDGLITEAKATFERTAQGLRTDLSAIQEYVNKDGQRQEALQRYTREESAKQATAVRELVNRDFVGKATYQEDVRGIERRFETITNPQNGSIATQIANYKQSVDGRFAGIISQIATKANQTDFQRVKETSQLYERILGNTDNGIADNVARMAMTNQLFQVEVSKAFGNHQNLFLNSTSVKGYLGNAGVIYVANSIQKEITSDFISVEPNEKIIFQHWVTLPENGMAWTAWQFFDKNKNPIDNRKPGLNAYKTTVGKQHNINQITVPTNAYFVRFSARMYDDGLIKVEKGSAPSDYSVAPNDALEAVKTVQRQLDGSWSVQNLTSAGSIVSQINATNNQILIEAEKIRLKGKTLLDELTAIQGYFKRLFVGDASVGTLNSDIIRSNSITADKLVMDMAMARRFVSSDIFTDTLAAKEAFINKLRSVVVTATLLEGYKGRIGGFQIGTHEKDSSVYWITGENQFSVGMSNGSGQWSQTALWVNWGNNWGYPGDYAWYVKNNGKMYCYNTAEFWNTPVIHGDLRVTGHIYYNNENSGKSGYWIHSSKYSNFEPSNNYLYLYYSGSGYDWIPMNKEISDRRYKSNIEASTVSGLDVVKNLKTYSYRKEYDGKIEDIACGIMAQDVQKYAPEAFFENPDGAYSYNTFALVPYLIKAIQELNHKIEKLEKTA